MEKTVELTGGTAFLGSHLCAPLLKQECEGEAVQECGASRSSGRRRSAGAATKREPIWTVPFETILVGASVLLREGLARILTAAGFRIIASSSCADDCVLSTLPQQQSILLVIDVSDDFDAGLRQVECFKRRYPGGRVAVLADQHQLTKMVAAFRAGANAYLERVATCETFIKSLELIMLGGTFLPPEILNLVYERQAGSRNDCAARDGHADHNDVGGEDTEILVNEVETNKAAPRAESSYTPRLSARQRSILRCLVDGDPNKTIARKMAMSEATVKVHVKAILRKIRVHSRTKAAIWAMNNHPFKMNNHPFNKDDATLVLEKPPVKPSNIPEVLSACRRTDEHHFRRSNSKELRLARCG